MVVIIINYNMLIFDLAHKANIIIRTWGELFSSANTITYSEKNNKFISVLY